MYRLATGIAAGLAFSTGAIAQEDGSSNAKTSGIVETIRGALANVVVESSGEVPDPQAQMQYEDTTKFDLQLYSSLLNLQETRVTLDQPSTTLPERLADWTAAVHKRNPKGTVLECSVNEGDGFGFLKSIFGFVVNAVIQLAKDEVQEWALYRPAQDVNAIIELRPSLDSKVEAVRFISRENDLSEVEAEYSECKKL